MKRKDTELVNIQKSLGQGLAYVNDLVIDHNINNSKDNPLAGSSYVKLPKESDHPRKGLINIRNIDDNECFKWSLVIYLHLSGRNPARITKVGKYFAKRLDFKDVKFPVKIRELTKLKKKKRILLALVLLVMKIRKNIQSMYQENVVKIDMLIYY